MLPELGLVLLVCLELMFREEVVLVVREIRDQQDLEIPEIMLF